VKTVVHDEGDLCANAVTELEYTFQNTFREAELYFPISELAGISSFVITYNGEDITGILLPEYPEKHCMPARVTLPPQGVPDHPEKAAPHILYHFFKGGALTDLDVGASSVLRVKFGYPLPSNTGDNFLCILPLSIFPKAPDCVILSASMSRRITRITSANLDNANDMRVLLDGKSASCILHNPEESIQLEDDHFLLEIDLRESDDWEFYGWVLSLTFTFLILFFAAMHYMFPGLFYGLFSAFKDMLFGPNKPLKQKIR
jgi:hypothetical protein